MSVGQPADQNVEQNDKGHAESGEEEPKLLSVRLLFGHDATPDSNGIEQKESTQTHGSI